MTIDRIPELRSQDFQRRQEAIDLNQFVGFGTPPPSSKDNSSTEEPIVEDAPMGAEQPVDELPEDQKQNG